MKRHEVLVLGGGPGGSITAAYLARRGVDVAIFEKESFPRFHIGESLLPHSMDIFREIGVFDRLNSGKYLRKFGAQFLHHAESDEVYFEFAAALDDRHPMAFEVPRAGFDRDLLEHAVSLGATLYQPETVLSVECDPDKVRVTTDREHYEARFIADSSGRDAFLGKQYKLRFPNLDLNNVGVFTHFTGVGRFDGPREGDITIGMLPGGRWCWVIPFQGERTSAGVVCSSKDLRQNGDLDAHLMTALRSCPGIGSRFARAERVEEIGVISNYSHYCEKLMGPRWILVGDAASFLDPIFSSGVHLAVSMGREAAHVLCAALDVSGSLDQGDLQEHYERFVRVGTRRFHAFIRLFYDTHFVRDMKKTYGLKHMRAAFTSVVAGDVWNEDNLLFRTGVLS